MVLILISLLLTPLSAAVAPPDGSTLQIRRAEYEMHPGHVAIKDHFGTTYFMSPKVELSDADVRSAEFLPAGDGRPRVKLLFTRQGANKFGDLTRSHLKRPLVFLIQGKVVMVPLVNEVAAGDSTWIEGLITEAEAKGLATAISSRKATVR